MRRDLIIGLIISLIVHGSIGWVPEWLGHSPPPPRPKEEAPTVQLLEMPKMEPDEPEKVESAEEQQPMDFAPPMQADVPQVVTPTSFVQNIQPPPPENLQINRSAISIPAGNRNVFKGIEVFDLSKLDQQPVARVQGRPQYPFEMRRAGIAGDVLVDFIVDSNGDVQNAYAAKSSQREFESAAIQAVSKWKFKPGRKGGRAVNTHMQVPIVFTLNDE